MTWLQVQIVIYLYYVQYAAGFVQETALSLKSVHKLCYSLKGGEVVVQNVFCLTRGGGEVLEPKKIFCHAK